MRCPLLIFINLLISRRINYKANLQDKVEWHGIAEYNSNNEIVDVIKPTSQNIANFVIFVKKDQEERTKIASSIQGSVNSKELDPKKKYGEIVLLESGKYKVTPPVSPEGLDSEDPFIFEDLALDKVPGDVKDKISSN